MVCARTHKIFIASLIATALGNSALAATDTCERDDAVDDGTLRATRAYFPPGSDDGTRTLAGPSWFFVPLAAGVVAGQSGPFFATLSWRDAHGKEGVCLYRGTGEHLRTRTCAGNGDEYRFVVCTLFDDKGISFFGADELIRAATQVRFHILDGDSCAPTVAEVDLTSPPDRDGDGAPDCLEPPHDTAPPLWPPGSVLSATSSAGSATLVWSAAIDDVGVAGYRLYEDDTLVDELSASELSAQVGSVSPNVDHVFQVQAFDAAGNQSTDGPSARVLVDTLPPSWPAGATLFVTPTGPSAAGLSWPPATDAVGVVAYRVYEDDVLFATVTETSSIVAGLDPSHTYRFVVQAVDAAGNASKDGPAATLLLDETAPVWPAGSTLAGTIRGGTATLVWTAATDNVGVVGYRLFEEGQMVEDLPSSVLAATVAGLAANAPHAFQIQAFDAAGNLSADGPITVLLEDTAPPTWSADSTLSAARSSLTSATLTWTPADDNVGVAAYLVFANGLPVAQTNGSVLSTIVLALNPSVLYTFQVQAQDGSGNISIDGPTTSLRIDANAPTWPDGARVTVTPSSHTGVSVSWVAATDDTAVQGYRVFLDGQPVRDVTTLATNIENLDPETQYTIEIEAFDAAGNVSTGGPSASFHIGVPPPAAVAPPLDPSIATLALDAFAFLVEGQTPIQAGVQNGILDRKRAVLVRGRVLDTSGNALQDVNIATLNHSELGFTRTHVDGTFDFLLNGGGQLVLSYSKPGYVQVQRQIQPRWNSTMYVPDVVFTALDSNVTELIPDAAVGQVAQGSVVADRDGARRETILLPADTSISVVSPDGTVTPLATAHLHVTEVTVGKNGPAAMPGDLPPLSRYTHAVDLSVDEALEAGASSVAFSKPVSVYVDNFLQFPIGETVPVGSYDRSKGQWVAGDSGRVIMILGSMQGFALVDADGDGQPDSRGALAEIGITDEELSQLAELYAAGTSVWRFQTTHFSIFDCNWFGVSPLDGIFPTLPPVAKTLDPCPSKVTGSIIECESQILAEDIPIAGTSLSLHYQSDRALARSAERKIQIPLIGATVPQSLIRIELDVSVAGQFLHQEFVPRPELGTTFTWDGNDAYGRRLSGTQEASVRVSYVFPIVYKRTERFGNEADIDPLSLKYVDVGLSPKDRTMTLSQVWFLPLVVLPAPEKGLGGWTLSAHHVYDLASSTVLHGDGQRQHARTPGDRFLTADGGGIDLVSGPDGSLYYATSNTVWKLAPDGTKTIFAGAGPPGFGGDGGPAALALLNGPKSFEVGADGSVYILDSFNARVRRVDPLGFISTVAGNGTVASTGDGGPATSASIRPNAGAHSLAASPDGSLFIAEHQSSIRRVTPDGRIERYAGAPNCPNDFCYSGDGGPALLALLTIAGGIAADSQGSLYIASQFTGTVRRIDRSGVITRFAGNGQFASNGDDGPALMAAMVPTAIRVSQNGDVCIYDNFPGGRAIRCVDAAGLICRLAGTGQCSSSIEGTPALQTGICGAPAFTFLPNNQLIAQTGLHVLTYPISSDLRLTASLNVPSSDGTEVYTFDDHGRHALTRDTILAAPRFAFTYSNAGGLTGDELTSITDVDGNQLTIDRSVANQILLIAPFGQTTTLGLDSDRNLETLTDPLGQKTLLSYDRGLLTSLTDPLLGRSTFEYDDVGRLVKDTNSGGGYQAFGRTDDGQLSDVTRTTRLGRTTTYHTDLSNPSVTAKTFMLSGLRETVTDSASGTRSASYPNGTTVVSVVGPDPRFGMDAPIAESVTMTTPGGRTLAIAQTESVALSKPADPFSLGTLSVSSRVNGGPQWARTYSGATKNLTEKTPSGRALSRIVDDRGRVTQLNVPGRLPQTFQHDGRGRVVSVKQGTRSVGFEYDAAGKVARVTAPDGRDLRASYDALGRPLTVTRADGQQTQLIYELAGQRVSTLPPGRPAHTSQLNPEERTLEYRPPTAGGAVSNRLSQFDLDGQLQTATDGNGDVTTVERDTAGRPVLLNTPRGTFTYEHNQATGQLAGAHTPEGQSEAYTYDGPLIVAVGITGEVSGDVSFDYDANLRLATETVNGDLVAFGYDMDDLVTQVGQLVLRRDAASGDVTTTTVDDVSLAFGRNGYGEVDHLGATFASTLVFAADVASRDASGRILSRHDVIAGESHTRDYTYDVNGRLTHVGIDGVPSAHYEYDENGNRTERDGVDFVQALSYDAQDRLVSAGTLLYSYTADGALDTIVETATGATTTYRHDVAGNLLSVVLPNGDRIDYIVDAAGRRVGRKLNGALTSRWIYGAGSGPAAELGAGGEVVTRFVYGGSAWVPAYLVKSGAAYALVTDGVGSVRLVIEANTGAVAQRLDYDEFGRVLLDTSPGFQPFGFGGGLYDPATNLVRLGARDYDAETGRFTTKDPILFASGDTNVYAYVANDPINRQDPGGLTWLLGDGPLQWEYLQRQNYSHVSLKDAYYGVAGMIGLSCPWCAAAMIIATAENDRDPALVLGIFAGVAGAFACDDGIAAAAEGEVSRGTTTVVSDATVVSRGKVVGQGDVYLSPTIEGIESGKLAPRDIFLNREGLLPPRPPGYYQEFVHPTPGLSGPGSQRIVRGAGGELYYTPDHYATFIPLN